MPIAHAHVAQFLGELMTSQSVHEEGRSAAYRGCSRFDNPYTKGWGNDFPATARFTQQWDDGWCVGWAQRNTDLLEKRRDDARSDASEP